MLNIRHMSEIGGVYTDHESSDNSLRAWLSNYQDPRIVEFRAGFDWWRIDEMRDGDEWVWYAHRWDGKVWIYEWIVVL